MTINRREFLKTTGVGLAGLIVLPETIHPSSLSEQDGYGILYDANLCIGCRNCEGACKNRRDLPTEFEQELDADNWTIIKLYQDQENQSIYSFIKRNCMHCVDPACVSACPVGAMKKTADGPVVYDETICIGCRYCMAACPFDVPKYEWEKVFPRVQKCDMCADRIAEGKETACVESCKIGALQFGKRSDLLIEAHERIDKDPVNYINKVYGENEVGGTSVLIVSKISTEKLGLPVLSSSSLPSLTWPWMKAVPGVAFVVASLMTFLYWFTGRKLKVEVVEEIQNDSH
jgi:formate dehydrogenase iron-sulfur subunit